MTRLIVSMKSLWFFARCFSLLDFRLRGGGLFASELYCQWKNGGIRGPCAYANTIDSHI